MAVSLHGSAGCGPGRLVVFSDLDGTLLDPVSYSFREALPALAMLAARGIALVLVSSKTRPEIEHQRTLLGNRHPFVSENGGGIFIPCGYFPFTPPGAVEEGGQLVTVIGRPYAEVRRIFDSARRETGVRATGFGDMDDREVARMTRLPFPEARLARRRDFDEVFVFEEGEKRPGDFLSALERGGLRWTRGRFYHAMGEHDKGKAVLMLTALYARALGPVTTVGLGDAFNDLPLLGAVDMPFLVRRADGSFDEQVRLDGLTVTAAAGPAGWNEAIREVVERCDAQTP